MKNTDKLTDVQAEIRILHTDHAHIGQLLMAKWHMPEDVRACVAFHHDPSQAGDHRLLSLIVACSNVLSHIYGEHPRTTVGEDDAAKELKSLALSASSARENRVDQAQRIHLRSAPFTLKWIGAFAALNPSRILFWVMIFSFTFTSTCTLVFPSAERCVSIHAHPTEDTDCQLTAELLSIDFVQGGC